MTQPEPAKPRHPHDRADEDDERPVDTLDPGEYL